MKELLIYKLYFVLLSSEKLAEILFLYVSVCSFYFLQVHAYPGMFVGMFEAGGWKSHWLVYVQAWFLITSATRLLRAIYLCMADPNLSQHVCSSSFTNGIVYPFTPESSKRWRIYLFYLLEMAERVNYF